MSADIYQNGICSRSGRHDLFFSDRPEELALAQAMCARCPVQRECLRLALDQEMEWGVWGGVIFWDGQPLYRKRARGRPSRADRELPLRASVAELRELVGAP